MTKTEELKEKFQHILIQYNYDRIGIDSRMNMNHDFTEADTRDKLFVVELAKTCKEAGLEFVNKNSAFGEFSSIEPIEVE